MNTCYYVPVFTLDIGKRGWGWMFWRSLRKWQHVLRVARPKVEWSTCRAPQQTVFNESSCVSALDGGARVRTETWRWCDMSCQLQTLLPTHHLAQPTGLQAQVSGSEFLCRHRLCALEVNDKKDPNSYMHDSQVMSTRQNRDWTFDFGKEGKV